MSLRRLSLVLAAVLIAALVASPGFAKKAKRFGIEGVVLSFDEGKDTVMVKVAKTKVSGQFGSGGVAGGKPPGSVKRGSEIEFKVVPEGSVLKRTVLKSIKGPGLDNTGTKEGFKKALAMLPKDKPVVISFEKNEAAKADESQPEFVIKMMQVRLTVEELEAQFEANSVEE